MSTYYNLAKLGRTQLPSGTTYALIDVDGRAMITENYSSAASYSTGDLVIGTGFAFDSPNAPFNDCLLKAKTDIVAGPFDSTQWEVVTVASELSRLEDLISGGVHYVGKTTTKLIDGDRTNPIVIGGSSYTAKAGDMVIFDWSSSEVYQSDIAYSKDTYLVHLIQSPRQVFHGITNADITAARNTSWNSISPWVDILTSEPEFIFDGLVWNQIGTTTALGDLAFKDKVTGYYNEVTSATVTVSVPLPMSGKMGQTTIVGVGGTTDVSKMTAGTAKDVAKAGTAVRYGTADVGEAVTYGTADRASTATTVGNANVGTAVVYGTANVGEAVLVATPGHDVVYGTANVGSAVIYGTANVGETISNVGIAEIPAVFENRNLATGGVLTSVSGDCLTFRDAGTTTVRGISSTRNIAPAVKSQTTLTPAVAAPTTQKLTPVGDSTSINPAVSAPSSQTLTPAVASSTSIYGAVNSSRTLTPAVAAPNNQTIVPAVANGSITPWTETAKTVATAAASATTVGTGTIDLISGTGSEVLTGLSSTTETKTVTLTIGTGIVESK